MSSNAAAYKDNDIDFVIDIPALGDRLLTRLDAMRAADPIFWSDKNGAWVVTGHQEVVEGYYGKLPLSSVRLPFLAVAHVPEADRYTRFPHLMEAPKTWLLNMDDPEHQRLRRLMVKAFSRPVVEQIRPNIRRYIQETFTEVEQIEGGFDFVKHVARIIPARMILSQFGFDDKLIAKLHRWSIVMNSSGNLNVPVEMLEEIDSTLVEMRELFEPEFEKRRINPSDDFLSALVTANEAGDTLSNDEMFGICVIVLIAGHDTTANTMSLGAAALAQDPAACDTLRGNPAIAADAIMEIQRRIAMSTLMSRVVSEDFEWKGRLLRKGEFVLLVQAAANRDPAVFPEPEKLDFHRSQMQNLTFAPGLHHCIGFLLAKMVLQEFFPEFLRRFDVEILDKQLDFGTTMSFRSLDTLNVKLTPRGPAAVAQAAE